MKKGHIVAIDHGTKRIGIAVSDTGHSFAFPGSVFYSEEELCRHLRKIEESEGISVIVVGLPLNMDGTEGARAKDVRRFCDRLKAVFKLKIVTWDERLTSFEAESMLKDCRKRGKKGKEQVDLVASQLILRGYLASLDNSR